MSEPATQAEEADTLIGTTLAERYRIDKLLGVGGMGAVYRARHLLLKRDVAVKVLHAELSGNLDISLRFDREAQSAARLDHPNIIPVTEFGSTEDGMKFMVMQLLSGRELGDLLTNALDPLRAIELEIQILRGLEHAHNKGVIHRDLKPENVFVTVDHAGEEILKLVDFGIAKLIDDEDESESSQPLTRLGLIFGTPHYMSPEQATGSEIDLRTDIYSAGVMLYQMLSGELPFDHEDPVSLIRMQVTLDPPPLPTSVPPALVRVVKLMMAKARGERYPDARSARKALQAVQAQLASDAGVPLPVDSELSQPVDPADFDPNYPAPAPIDPVGSAAHSMATAPALPPSAATPSTIPPLVPTASSPALTRHSRPTMSLADSLAQSNSGSSSPRARLAALPRKWWYVGGGLLLLLVLIAVAPNGDSAAELPGDESPDPKIEPKEPAPIAVLGEPKGVGDEVLVSIDQALSSKDSTGALDLIRPERDRAPNNPQLLWREGKALAMQRAKSSKVTALERYGEALEYDATLIKDPEFFGELQLLLRDKNLLSQAIDLSLQKLGANSHKFLLELVNVDDPRKVLGWIDRHRILDELRRNEESAKVVDWKLNLARDLYQASEAPQPCIAFRDTLEAIAAGGDAYFIEHLHNSKLSAPTANAQDPADAQACPELEAKILITRDALNSAHPDEAAKFSKNKKRRR